MNRPKLYLHIGSHKTGTTAIQDFASGNVEWLRSAGLIYPRLYREDRRPARSHLALFSTLVRESGGGNVSALMSYLHDVRDEAVSDNLNVLLSAESLFRLDERGRGHVIAFMRAAFEGLEPVVVCALRNQADFAESLYRNSYRAFVRRPPPVELWLERAAGNFDYHGKILAYCDGLGARPMLLPYGPEDRTSFVRKFFAAIEVQVEAAVHPERKKNPSLDVVDCLAKLQVMQDDLDASVSRAFNNFAFKCPIRTNYAFVGLRARNALMKASQSCNRKLAEIEPELSAVLTEVGAKDTVLDVDDECAAMAEQRVQLFFDRRRN